MRRLKIARILFFLGALSFLARPFFGFALFNKRHHPVDDGILIKIFSKHKPELTEDSSSGYSVIEKKLVNPGIDVLPFNSFLDVLFPAASGITAKINAPLLLAAQRPPARPGWLLFGQIII